MSAPDVRVDTCYIGVCRHCHYYRTLRYGTDLDAEEDLRHHEETCPSLAVARLQPRWDARDEALRALIERWRADAARTKREHLGVGLCEMAVGYEACADELERAMADGR